MNPTILWILAGFLFYALFGKKTAAASTTKNTAPPVAGGTGSLADYLGKAAAVVSGQAPLKSILTSGQGSGGPFNASVTGDATGLISGLGNMLAGLVKRTSGKSTTPSGMAGSVGDTGEAPLVMGMPAGNSEFGNEGSGEGGETFPLTYALGFDAEPTQASSDGGVGTFQGSNPLDDWYEYFMNTGDSTGADALMFGDPNYDYAAAGFTADDSGWWFDQEGW